ncbi:MAG: class I mannose-6-phosphate isomerase [Bacteroidales bacterium]|nr:class I mannose-6-phosphate isomerase [Bacteroidales bacterium]
MISKLYPLIFRPNLHTVVWGGNRLAPWKKLGEQDNVGESWEVSAVPSSPSVVANGLFEGESLIDLVSRMPNEILGRKVAEKYGNKLPLLVKFIDSKSDLSIQVHPDDAMAQREHGKMGKTEMWYIIDAKPGSYLYAGFKKKVSKTEFEQLIEASKHGDFSLLDVLAKHEVHTGDVFYLPAGRVHAIGGGILLAEVQQSSDVTYRIFDYNRPGMDGKPRELHTELAAKAIDYRVFDEYKTQYVVSETRANHCIDSEFFCVRVVDIDRSFHRNLLKYDSFIITMCIKGSCHIKIRSSHQGIVLNEGESCLIPAAIADYDISPIGPHSLLLDAYIDNMDRSLGGMISRFLHIQNTV